MSVRDELHELVDQLEDETAGQVLDYARGLVRDEESGQDSALAHLNRRMRPGMVSGREFFAQREKPDFETLARQQGVRPVTRFEDLLGDFWPEDEKGEEFDEWLRRVRRDDNYD